MFVTDQLIYLQLHKTGCTHVEMLLDTLLGGSRIGKHERMPDEFRDSGKFVLGSVRNPWDWYVSLWAYGCGGQGGLYRSLTAPPRFRGHGFSLAPWTATRRLFHDLARPTRRWRKVYANADDPGLFREWLRMVHDPRRRHDLGEGYPDSPLSLYAGFFTYRYAALYARDADAVYAPEIAEPARLKAVIEQDTLLRFAIRNEHLEDDLAGALARCGIGLNAAQREIVYSGRRTNASRRRHPGYYYDRETLDLVARRDGLLIEKYGYSAPGEAE